ncbi:hypothetical protein ACFXQA_11655 [Microbacterium sp. P07]|uniref:hypothetical protein n=1 Tax=Microbacterium sp. P07 TaxID=3366952 RepID=UPI0037455C03
MPTRSRIGIPLALAAIVGALTVGCGVLQTISANGDDVARRNVEDIATQIAAHSDNKAEITVIEMVAFWVPSSSVGGEGAVTVEPLAWSGQIGSDSTATIDVRIHAEVEAYSSPAIFGDSHGPGEATTCFRFVWPLYDEAARTEIPCPDGPAPIRPTPAPAPDLDDADRATVVAVLNSGVDAEEAGIALREAFPSPLVTIESVDWRGQMVVAVGIPEERECILAARDADGAVSFPSFRQISLEPGEGGCSTSLYTNPPL